MYYAKYGSKNKVFHASGCPYIKDTKGCMTFASEDEARAQGYKQCDRCATIKTKYLNENNKIVKFLCKKYNMSVKLYDGRLYVFKGESGWMLMVNDKGDLLLFHRNLRSRHHVITTKLSDYHRQKIKASTVEEYLRYILYHESLDFQEKWALKKIEKYPIHSAKGRKRYCKKRKEIRKRFGIRRTLKLLNELKKNTQNG